MWTAIGTAASCLCMMFVWSTVYDMFSADGSFALVLAFSALSMASAFWAGRVSKEVEW